MKSCSLEYRKLTNRMEQLYSNPTVNDIRVRNEKAREIGLLIGISGEVYFLSISKVSDVYVDFINGQWVAWRERCTSGDLQSSDVKVIATSKSFDYVIARTEAYFSYLKKLRR